MRASGAAAQRRSVLADLKAKRQHELTQPVSSATKGGRGAAAGSAADESSDEEEDIPLSSLRKRKAPDSAAEAGNSDNDDRLLNRCKRPRVGDRGLRARVSSSRTRGGGSIRASDYDADDLDDFIAGDDEDEDEDEEEEDDDDEHGGALGRGGGSGFSHAAVDAERDAAEEAQGDDEGLGLATAFEELKAGSGANRLFKFEWYCRFLLAALVCPGELRDVLYNPDRRHSRDAKLWGEVRRAIEEMIISAKQALATSQAWKSSGSDPYAAEVFTILPFSDVTPEYDDRSDCRACGRAGHVISERIDFTGPAVDSDRLYATDASWIDAIPRGHHRAHSYSLLVGSQCSVRIRTYQALVHHKYHLLLSLSRCVHKWLDTATSTAVVDEDESDEDEEEAVVRASKGRGDDGDDGDGVQPPTQQHEPLPESIQRVSSAVKHLLVYARGRKRDADEAEEGWEEAAQVGFAEAGMHGKLMRRIRAITWATQPQRRSFLRSHAQLLAFLRGSQARVFAESSAQQQGSSSSSAGSKTKLSAADADEASKLATSWTDELVEPIRAIAQQLGLPSLAPAAGRLLCGLDTTSSLRFSSVAARRLQPVPWEDVCQLFDDDRWKRLIKREFRRWQALLSDTSGKYATESSASERASAFDVSGRDGEEGLRPPDEVCNAMMINWLQPDEAIEEEDGVDSGSEASEDEEHHDAEEEEEEEDVPAASYSARKRKAEGSSSTPGAASSSAPSTSSLSRRNKAPLVVADSDEEADTTVLSSAAHRAAASPLAPLQLHSLLSSPGTSQPTLQQSAPATLTALSASAGGSKAALNVADDDAAEAQEEEEETSLHILQLQRAVQVAKDGLDRASATYEAAVRALEKARAAARNSSRS